MESESIAPEGRPHVLQITNHGVHEWQVVPGLPDTGGQNVYVNQFTEALISQGYRVTIANRGGYLHQATGQLQAGMVPHASGHARILYLDDGTPDFVRKEDMNDHLPALAEDLTRQLVGDPYDLIISHYWDGGKLGALVNRNNPQPVPHVWVPHSLGALKKRNMDPSTWENLRIDERIEEERSLLPEITGAVATSSAIRDTFRDDYGYEAKYFLPPCVDAERYRPRTAGECEGVWDFLAESGRATADELRERKVITEISRTDGTKRKDVLIRAFAQVKEAVPDALLVVAIDERAGALYFELLSLIDQLGISDDVVVLGSVWAQLPCLYAVTTVYCTPSVMEGFGMSAQEAAATARPVVSSDLVPYVQEYLLGEFPMLHKTDGYEFRVGEGGIVVPADDVDGFAAALTLLLSETDQREAMGRQALNITVPYFTWEHRARDLLEGLGVTPNGGRDE
jgi:glycosyltransferase involved in cell wall biosynthesis